MTFNIYFSVVQTEKKLVQMDEEIKKCLQKDLESTVNIMYYPANITLLYNKGMHINVCFLRLVCK